MELDVLEELKSKLSSHGLEYIDLETMMAEGYYDPPDLKIVTPFAYNGKKINWIDMSTIYGSERNHQIITNIRLLNFVEDMGSGLCIYINGFDLALFEESDENIVVADYHFATTCFDIEELE